MKTLFAVLLLGLAALPAALQTAWAHEEAAAAPIQIRQGPQRLADGRLFFPKSSQRLLELRTLAVRSEQLPLTQILNARIISDPQASAHVAALARGRIQAVAGGLPLAGQTVKRGQLLARLLPQAGNTSLAAQRLARMQALADTVPRKDIEEAAAAVALEELRAPMDGVIAMNSVVNGQVVDTGTTLFTLIDPHRLMVEALVYEPLVAADVSSAWLQIGNQQRPLQVVGLAAVLNDQARSLYLRAVAPKAGKPDQRIDQADAASLADFAVGQTAQVYLNLRRQQPGMRVPAAAVVKDSANQNIVWLKTAAETFTPQAVRVSALNGHEMMIEEGLHDGDRVVVTAAALLNQVR